MDISNTEFPLINTEELKDVVKEVVIDCNEPVHIHGTFGGGKSAVISQACEEVGAELVDIRLSQYDSVDLRGFPGVSRTTGQTVWHPPSTMPFVGNDAFPDDRPILVFFDERGSAQISVKAVAYQMINDRRCGEHVFKPNVRLISASNLEDDKGISIREPMPLNNRETHYQLVLDVDAFCAYANSVGIPPIFVAFWNWRKPLIHNYDPKKNFVIVATQRTWFKAVKYYTSKMSEGMKIKAMQGAIGKGPASEFWGFVEVWQNIVPLKKIIADPLGVAVPTEASHQYATAINVSGGLSRKTSAPLAQFLERMPVTMQVLAWTMAGKRDESLTTTNEFIQFAKKYRDVFNSNY